MRSVDTGLMLGICPGLENCLSNKFDDMLWMLMQNAAEKTHVSMEPWYSCLDPNLPGFHALVEDDDRVLYEHNGVNGYVQAPKKSALREQRMKEDVGVVGRMMSFFTGSSVDEKKAKGEHPSNCWLEFHAQFHVNPSTSLFACQRCSVNEASKKLHKRRTFFLIIGRP